MIEVVLSKVLQSPDLGYGDDCLAPGPRPPQQLRDGCGEHLALGHLVGPQQHRPAPHRGVTGAAGGKGRRK